MDLTSRANLRHIIAALTFMIVSIAVWPVETFVSGWPFRYNVLLQNEWLWYVMPGLVSVGILLLLRPRTARKIAIVGPAGLGMTIVPILWALDCYVRQVATRGELPMWMLQSLIVCGPSNAITSVVVVLAAERNEHPVAWRRPETWVAVSLLLLLWWLAYLRLTIAPQ